MAFSASGSGIEVNKPLTAGAGVSASALTVSGQSTLGSATFSGTVFVGSSSEAGNEVATKGYVDQRTSSVYRVKGSVPDMAALLAITDMVQGDVYNVVDDGSGQEGNNYVWDGTKWDKLGGTIDLSPYHAMMHGVARQAALVAAKFSDLDVCAVTAPMVEAYLTGIGSQYVSGDMARYRYINKATMTGFDIYTDGTAFDCDLLMLATAPTPPATGAVVETVAGTFSSLEDASGMFEGVTSLTEFNAYIPNVTNATAMFQGCTSLTKFDSICQSIVTGTNMFQGCTSLTDFNGNLHNLNDAVGMFEGCPLSLASLRNIAAYIGYTEDGTITIDYATDVPQADVEEFKDILRTKGWTVVDPHDPEEEPAPEA